MASSISDEAVRRDGRARPFWKRRSVGLARAMCLTAAGALAPGGAVAHAAGEGAAVRAAPASEATREAARARLVEGVELLRRGEHAAALAKFQEGYALVPSPNIHYDRGLAYEGLGREAEALDAFEAFLAHAEHPPAGTPEEARRHCERLRARVATLEIATDPPDAEVAIDGRNLDRAAPGGAVHVEAGTHEVAARIAATGATARQRVAVAPGNTVRISLRLMAPAASPPAQLPVGVALAPTAPSASTTASIATSPPLITSSSDESGPARRWALPTAGAGVALLGLGVTFGLLARQQGDDLTRDSRASMPPERTIPFDASKESAGLRYQTLEEVFLVTGGAALAAGLVLYLMGRPSDRHAARDGRPSSTLSSSLEGTRLRVSF